uniref:Uncharacterized protein n=1 Tax=Anguilla anguilla TaxID=7936 RepID=A0A0E9XBC0_ANGAN
MDTVFTTKYNRIDSNSMFEKRMTNLTLLFRAFLVSLAERIRRSFLSLRCQSHRVSKRAGGEGS